MMYCTFYKNSAQNSKPSIYDINFILEMTIVNFSNHLPQLCPVSFIGLAVPLIVKGAEFLDEYTGVS